MDRSSRQNNNKETQDLNETLNQMDLADTKRIFYPRVTEYFSQFHMEYFPR